MSIRIRYPDEFDDSTTLGSQMEFGQFWRDYGQGIV
jgi:hypothetical protein